MDEVRIRIDVVGEGLLQVDAPVRLREGYGAGDELERRGEGRGRGIMMGEEVRGYGIIEVSCGLDIEGRRHDCVVGGGLECKRGRI